MLQGQHAQHRGIASGADGHGVAGAQVAGNPVEPFAAYAGALCQAAVVAHAQVPAIEHDAVAWLEVGPAGFQHHACQIDAGNERERPDDRTLAGEGKRILVVERGVLDLYQDVAVHQVGFIEIDQFRGYAVVRLAGQQCLETHGWGLTFSGWPHARLAPLSQQERRFSVGTMVFRSMHA